MLRHPNDVLACYVTAEGRMHLYSYLDTLQKRAVHRQGQRYLYSTKRWRGIGEDGRLPRRDDVRANAVRIHIRVREWRAKELCVPVAQYAGEESTVRGNTLKYCASQLVKFEKLKQMILRSTETDTVTVHTARQIKRKRGKDGEGRILIVTEPEDKTYRV